ncbi:MAG: hypothetical protein LBJ10_01980 [Clostridiales bacterium]|jgi:hypothetical protein|nr:hypothetical protein [Clostridiales bacterium]
MSAKKSRRTARRASAYLLAAAVMMGAMPGIGAFPAGAADDWAARQSVSLTFDADNFKPGGTVMGVEWNTQAGLGGYDGISVAPQLYGKPAGGDWNDEPNYGAAADSGGDARYAFEAGRRDAVRDGAYPYTMTAMKLHPDFASGLAGQGFEVRVTYLWLAPSGGTGQGFYLWKDEGVEAGPGRVKPDGDSGAWSTAVFSVDASALGSAGWGYDLMLIAEDPVWIHSVAVEKLPGEPADPLGALQATYSLCEGAQPGEYTAESWEVFQAALEAAKDLLDAQSGDEAALASANGALKSAFSALAPNARKALQNAVGQYGERYAGGNGNAGGSFTEESWGDFAAAMEAALALLEADLGGGAPEYSSAEAALAAAYGALAKAGAIEGSFRYEYSGGEIEEISDGVWLEYLNTGLSASAAGAGYQDRGALITTAGGAWGNPHIRLNLDGRFDTGRQETYVVAVEYYYAGAAMDSAIGMALNGGGWSSYSPVSGGSWRTANITTALVQDPANGHVGTIEWKAGTPFQIHSVSVRTLVEGEEPPPPDPRTPKEQLEDQLAEYLPKLAAGNAGETFTSDSWGAFEAEMAAAQALLGQGGIGGGDALFAKAKNDLIAAYGGLRRSSPLSYGSVRYENNGGSVEEDSDGVWLAYGGSESPHASLGAGNGGKGAVIVQSVEDGAWGNAFIEVHLDENFHTGKAEDFVVTLEYYASATRADAIGIAHRGGWSAYSAAETGKWATKRILVQAVSWPADEYVFHIEVKAAPIQIHSASVQLLDASGAAEHDPNDFGAQGPGSDWANEISVEWGENGLAKNGLAYSDHSNALKYELVELGGKWGAKTEPMSGVQGAEIGASSYGMYLNVPDAFKGGGPAELGEIELTVEYWDSPLTSRLPADGTNYGPDDRQYGFYVSYLQAGNENSGRPDQWPFGTSVAAKGAEEWKAYSIRMPKPYLGRPYYGFDMCLYVQEGMIIHSITISKPKEINLSAGSGGEPYLFYAGEAIELPASVTNSMGGAQTAAVEAALYGYDGILVATAAASAVLEEGKKAELRPAFAAGAVPKGAYRVVFTAKDGDGNAYSSYSDYLTVVESLEDLSEAGVIDIDSFGVATHFLWYGNDDAKNDAAMQVAVKVMKAAGITTVRDEYTWFEVEPYGMDQEYVFAHDRWLALLLRAGITPVICLNYGHDWWGWDPANGKQYSAKTGANFEEFPKAGLPLANNPYIKPGSPAAGGKTYVQASGDYVYALLSHFASPPAEYPELAQLKIFEIWNEPNNVTDADTFFTLLKEHYVRAKQAIPDSYIVGSATCFYVDSFINRLMDLGGWQYMDAFSYHYPDYPRDSTGRMITQAAKIQDYARQVSKGKTDIEGRAWPDGKHLPVWVTELGESNSRYPETLTAAWYAQYYVEQRAYFDPEALLNESIYIYTLQNYTTMPSITAPVENHGITYAEGPYAPKPAVASLNAAAWLTRGTVAGERYDGLFEEGHRLYSPAPLPGKPVRAYTFYGTDKSGAAGPGEQVVALYSYSGAVSASLRVGDGFRLYDGYGNLAGAAAVNGTLALTLTEMPTYIVLPEGSWLDTVALGAGMFAVTPASPSASAGGTLSLTASRAGEAAGLAGGSYRASLPAGWALVDGSGAVIGSVPFGAGAEDEILIRLSADAKIGDNPIALSAFDASGNAIASMAVSCSVLLPMVVESYPVMGEDGAWAIEAKITNNGSEPITGASILASTPPAGAISFGDIAGGGSGTARFAYPALNENSLSPVSAVLAAGGQEVPISRNFSALAAYRANAGFDAANPDWDGVNWGDAMPVLPDYANYRNHSSGKEWGGKADLDFAGGALWDDEYLYFYVDVSDDRHVLTSDINNSWAQDSLQISIDPLHAMGTARDQYGAATAAGYAGELSIIAALREDGVYGMAIQYNTVPGLSDRNLADSRVLVARDEEAKTTAYRLALSWKDILTEGQLAPASGFSPQNTHMGIAVTVNDSDQGTDRGWLNYMDGIAFGKDARLFGDLALVGQADPGEPGDPEEPGDPDDPDEPGEPGDPEEPGDAGELSSVAGNAAAFAGRAGLFTEAAAGALGSALAAANAAIGGGAPQGELDAALAALRAALASIRLKDEHGEFGELVGLLAYSAGLDAGKYTPASWGRLQAAADSAWELIDRLSDAGAEPLSAAGAAPLPEAEAAWLSGAGAALLSGAGAEMPSEGRAAPPSEAGAAPLPEEGAEAEQLYAALADVRFELYSKALELRIALLQLEEAGGGGPAAGPKMTAGISAAADRYEYAEEADGTPATATFALYGKDIKNVALLNVRLSYAEGARISVVPVGPAAASVRGVIANGGDDVADIPLEGFATSSFTVYANPGESLSVADGEPLLEITVELGERESGIVSLIASHLDIYCAVGGADGILADVTIDPSAAAALVAVYSRFDINRDGKVDLADVDIVRRSLGKAAGDGGVWESELLARCDLGGGYYDEDGNELPDGAVGVADLTLALARYEREVNGI